MNVFLDIWIQNCRKNFVGRDFRSSSDLIPSADQCQLQNYIRFPWPFFSQVLNVSKERYATTGASQDNLFQCLTVFILTFFFFMSMQNFSWCNLQLLPHLSPGTSEKESGSIFSPSYHWVLGLSIILTFSHIVRQTLFSFTEQACSSLIMSIFAE